MINIDYWNRSNRLFYFSGEPRVMLKEEMEIMLSKQGGNDI